MADYNILNLPQHAGPIPAEAGIEIQTSSGNRHILFSQLGSGATHIDWDLHTNSEPAALEYFNLANVSVPPLFIDPNTIEFPVGAVAFSTTALATLPGIYTSGKWYATASITENIDYEYVAICMFDGTGASAWSIRNKPGSGLVFTNALNSGPGDIVVDASYVPGTKFLILVDRDSNTVQIMTTNGSSSVMPVASSINQWLTYQMPFTEPSSDNGRMYLASDPADVPWATIPAGFTQIAAFGPAEFPAEAKLGDILVATNTGRFGDYAEISAGDRFLVTSISPNEVFKVNSGALSVMKTITVKVPTDYPTLQDAVTNLKNNYIIAPDVSRATIILESSLSPINVSSPEDILVLQARFHGGDHSWLTIANEDFNTPIEINIPEGITVTGVLFQNIDTIMPVYNTNITINSFSSTLGFSALASRFPFNTAGGRLMVFNSVGRPVSIQIHGYQHGSLNAYMPKILVMYSNTKGQIENVYNNCDASIYHVNFNDENSEDYEGDWVSLCGNRENVATFVSNYSDVRTYISFNRQVTGMPAPTYTKESSGTFSFRGKSTISHELGFCKVHIQNEQEPDDPAITAIISSINPVIPPALDVDNVGIATYDSGIFHIGTMYNKIQTTPNFHLTQGSMNVLGVWAENWGNINLITNSAFQLNTGCRISLLNGTQDLGALPGSSVLATEWLRTTFATLTPETMSPRGTFISLPE